MLDPCFIALCYRNSNDWFSSFMRYFFSQFNHKSHMNVYADRVPLQMIQAINLSTNKFMATLNYNRFPKNIGLTGK